jgi:hypothetical protein
MSGGTAGEILFYLVFGVTGWVWIKIVESLQ